MWAAVELLMIKMSCGVRGASSSPDDVDCAKQDVTIIRSKTAIFGVFRDAIDDAIRVSNL